MGFALATVNAAARDHMVREGVGRLAVVDREEPFKVVAMLTRSDLLTAHRRRLEEAHAAERTFPLVLFFEDEPTHLSTRPARR
jgi:hypothetical protein